MTQENTNNTKQAAWVAVGGLCSISMGIISSMILSRYFDIREYGTYKQILFVYHTLLSVFTLGLPKAYAYFLPKSPNNEAKSLIKKLNYIFFILGAILSITLFISAGAIASALENPALKEPMQWFSPVPFLMLPTMGLEGILATYKRTKLLAIYTFLTRFVMLLCVALPVCLFNANCTQAIIGFVIGSIFAFVLALYLKFLPVKRMGETHTEVSYSIIMKFCWPLFLATIWGSLINGTDQFFISRYFGTDEFAIYSNGAMELPFVGMIISATSAVLIPAFTRIVHNKAGVSTTLVPLWNNAFGKSAMLIYPLTIFCIFEAMPIMVVLYGDLYANSSIYFQINCISYFVRIIAFYAILMALGEMKFYQRVLLNWFIIMIILDVIIAKFSLSPYLISVVHTIKNIGSSFAMLFFIKSKLKVTFCQLIPFKILFKVLVCSTIAASCSTWFCIYIYCPTATFWELVLKITIFCITCAFTSYVLKINYIALVKPIIKH